METRNVKNAAKNSKENMGKSFNTDKVVENANKFGNIIIDALLSITTDLEGIATATAGLAKAVATLKELSRCCNADVDDLFETLLKGYEEEIRSIMDESI